jgi:threonine dehydrogenase-like Zn-dependent dehydrogenase
VIDCIRKGLIKPTDFITHNVPFSEVKEKFGHLLQANKSLIKALISFDE